MKDKYLFLFLRTGGGHLAPAKALANYLESQYPEQIETKLIDGLELTNRVVKYLIEDGYRISQNKASWIFEALYGFNKIPVFSKSTNANVSYFVKDYLKDIIINEDPQKIIILHFFLIKPVYDILRELNLNIPVYTIVTDPYTAHPIWFHEKSQNLIVFSERVKEYAIKKKIPAENITVFPFILDEKFSQQIPANNIDELKTTYGFTPGKKLVLIMGGGDGIAKGKSILGNLLEAGLDAEIAIVCGRNQKLYQKAMELKSKFPMVNIQVYQFVDFVYELINMAAIVITKCGASTFMEILMQKKIPLINNYIWEQEKGNMEFVVENQLGIYEPNISKLPFVLKSLLSDEELYQTYITNIENLNLKSGTKDVAEFIVNQN
jgi:UDP-N-acetylglucosamine:LPS N-acetylglucosamine transferase